MYKVRRVIKDPASWVAKSLVQGHGLKELHDTEGKFTFCNIGAK